MSRSQLGYVRPRKGSYLIYREFKELLSAAADSLIILDEAYISFVEDAWLSTNMIWENNLLILRSMSKDYALAGLRLGYAIAREEIIEPLCRLRPPWNINVVAQQAGIVAVQSNHFLEQTRPLIAEAKDFLVKELTHLGFSKRWRRSAGVRGRIDLVYFSDLNRAHQTAEISLQSNRQS